MPSPAPARGAPGRLIEALLLALLLGVLVATRALDANAFVTWDEPAWTYRSAHFLLALTRGDLRATAITGHPGVTTTWLGAVGLAWHAWVARTIDWAQVLAVGALPTLEVHDAATMRLLGTLLPAAKSALPLAHAAIALALYALLRRLAGWGVAFAGLAVLALDPYYLALSRVLHIDALTAGLMLVSVLAALLYVREGRPPEDAPRRYLLVSGAAAGLAAVTKTYGAFVAPLVLALLAGGALLPRRSAPGTARQGSSLRSERQSGADDDPRSERPSSQASVVPNAVRDLDALDGLPRDSARPSPQPSRQMTSDRIQEEGDDGPAAPSPDALDGPYPLPHLRPPVWGASAKASSARVGGLGPLGGRLQPAAPHGVALRLLRAARDGALWGGLAIVAFALAWPAMWVAPVETLGGVLGLSLEYATDPGDATASFFRGALTDDPGAAFYPVALLYRATPLALVGVVLAVLLAVAGLVRAWRRSEGGDPRHALTWGLLAYAAVHLALLTLSAKKFDRYMLPALLALDVVAAIGWFGALGAIVRRARRWGDTARAAPIAGFPAAGVAIAAVAQAAFLLAPLSLSRAIACYNPLAGGLAGAVRALPVGWGEGIEEAARYLAAQPGAERLRVATWAVAGVAPHFPGQVDKPTAESLPNADYVVVYVGDVQGETPLAAAFADHEPALVARVAGQPYAWVYANTYGEALGREIEGMAASGEAASGVVVLDAPSAFERQYRGALRWGVVSGDEPEVARGLAELLRGAEEVVYVAYDGQPSHIPIRRLLARNALLLAERPFFEAGCSATLYRFRLLPEASILRAASSSEPGDAVFGGELALEGYGLSSDAIEYRQELGVVLRWRALARSGHDYHVSLRLVDADGRTWGQYDAPLEDAEGLRVTAWDAGTEHDVDLPVTIEPGTPPGAYRALLSLYRLDDLGLLEVVVDAEAPSRQFDLGAVRVRPATAPPRDEELAVPNPVDVTLGDRTRVLGYALSRDVVPSGEEVVVTLYWRCLEALDGDYDLLLRVAADGREVGRTRARPVGDGHPTDRWRPGEALRSAHAVRVDPDAAGGSYEVTISLVPRDGDIPLAAADAVLASLTVEHVERLFDVPAIGSPLEARFGDDPDAAIALLGYDLAEADVSPGDTLQLTLYWRADGSIDRSYTAFVHLLDGGGVVRGQRDSVPMEGARPTDGWLEGEVVVDAYTFTVVEDAPAGPHQIEIGLYDATTGERLPVTDAGGAPIPERRLLLDRTISVLR